jgi:hypothetical protein
MKELSLHRAHSICYSLSVPGYSGPKNECRSFFAPVESFESRYPFRHPSPCVLLRPHRQEREASARRLQRHEILPLIKLVSRDLEPEPVFKMKTIDPGKFSLVICNNRMGE